MGRGLRRLGRGSEDRGGPEGPDLAADLALQVPHVAAEREDVTRDQGAGMHDDIAVHRHQVPVQPPVDIGVAPDYEQVPFE